MQFAKQKNACTTALFSSTLMLLRGHFTNKLTETPIQISFFKISSHQQPKLFQKEVRY